MGDIVKKEYSIEAFRACIPREDAPWLVVYDSDNSGTIGAGDRFERHYYVDVDSYEQGDDGKMHKVLRQEVRSEVISTAEGLRMVEAALAYSVKTYARDIQRHFSLVLPCVDSPRDFASDAAQARYLLSEMRVGSEQFKSASVIYNQAVEVVNTNLSQVNHNSGKWPTRCISELQDKREMNPLPKFTLSQE